MHDLADKNKYVGFLFMRISPEYFALGREGIHEISAEHARDLGRFAKQLTHVVCTGVNGKYDQVTMVEADTLEEINAAATAFRMGNKARYIEIVDIVVGMKPRRAAWPTGPASPADRVARPAHPTRVRRAGAVGVGS